MRAKQVAITALVIALGLAAIGCDCGGSSRAGPRLSSGPPATGPVDPVDKASRAGETSRP